MASVRVEAMRVELGKRLAVLVEKSGKSQEKGSALLGIHQTSLSAAMRGKVSVEKLINILEMYGDVVKIV